VFFDRHEMGGAMTRGRRRIDVIADQNSSTGENQRRQANFSVKGREALGRAWEFLTAVYCRAALLFLLISSHHLEPKTSGAGVCRVEILQGWLVALTLDQRPI
jgi:hypothetical protein